MSWGPVTSHFKNNLGRYRPGNKGEKAGGETATGQKGRNDCFPGVYKKQLERQSRSISAGKQRPKGGELKAMGPKGLHRYFLGIGKQPLQKESWPISAGKQPEGG